MPASLANEQAGKARHMTHVVSEPFEGVAIKAPRHNRDQARRSFAWAGWAVPALLVGMWQFGASLGFISG